MTDQELRAAALALVAAWDSDDATATDLRDAVARLRILVGNEPPTSTTPRKPSATFHPQGTVIPDGSS